MTRVANMISMAISSMNENKHLLINFYKEYHSSLEVVEDDGIWRSYKSFERKLYLEGPLASLAREKLL